MSTSADRMARLRTQRTEAGLVQCNLWVTPAAMADLQQAAEAMRVNPALTVRLVDRVSGRAVSLKRGGKV